MLRQRNGRKWSRLIAFFLIGTVLQSWLPIFVPDSLLARTSCEALARPLKVQERRYAEAAWKYFQVNYESSTGLVSDRHDVKAASLWGVGDYLAALQAARSLNIIENPEFARRTRQVLATLNKLPLVVGELPARHYDIRSLQFVDDAGKPVSEGTGWSSLDVGRLLVALV